MPLDRPLDARVVRRLAKILLPDTESEIPYFINEDSARKALIDAGVDPAEIGNLHGNSLVSEGLLIANEVPAVIEAYLCNATHLLNGLDAPDEHDEMVGKIRAALQLDGFDLKFSGNEAEVVPYRAPTQDGPGAPPTRDDKTEIDRVIRWFERLPDAERTLTQQRRASEKLRAHAKYPIEDEYDVQDLFLAFLRLEYPRAHKEDPTFASAGLSGRVDIVVPELKLYIELKHHGEGDDWAATRRSLSDKVLHYPDGLRCMTMLLAIFDAGFSLAKEIIEHDFQKKITTTYGDVEIRAVVASRTAY